MTYDLRVALFEPRIPQNTGNIARTCAAFKLPLDLIEPFGFSLHDKYLIRAGLDYWKYLDISVYSKFNDFHSKYVDQGRVIGFSKSANISLQNYQFSNNDILLFGREDIGLPPYVRDLCVDLVKIPMQGQADKDGNNGVRSLNLSSAVAIASFYVLQRLKEGGRN
tara:strand:+ start:631 stop:1125 length:495 start_codon:yes stop_codon:yes gene_type:complete